ncbi:MAG: nucleoside triphosphate pyrophosphohydrolase [Acidimicrobiia bacterium]|nr:MAG: nucleoside triphosphate pyrophosphohydrolase [Acidimicrobiia bacterium]
MITIVGLGPAGADQLTRAGWAAIESADRVIVRTLDHPAADDIARVREVETCDDLYEQADGFSEVYERIAERVLTAGAAGPVVYAVPGHPAIAERAVGLIRERAGADDLPVQVIGAPSFLDVLMERLELDPLDGGLQLLDARQLPDPLFLGLPTVFAQVDTPLVAGDLTGRLLEVLEPDHPVVVATDLGTADELLATVALADLDQEPIGPRTSVYLDPGQVGLPGLLAVSLRLRQECPWDAKQTHHSLARHLIEEAYELMEAIGRLPADAPAGDADVPAYLEVEEELGDVLLQVIFHSMLAAEAGVFDIESVAEHHRRKLVSRHPHVFGVDGEPPIEVNGAPEVTRNWEKIKQAEKGRDSLMDDVPVAMPALARAAKMQRRASSVGFDWERPADVLPVLRGELEELSAALGDTEAVEHELGDVLFTLVNLARHLHIDPEMSLRQAVDRFSERFRSMEATGDLHGLTIDELNKLWEQAKRPPASGPQPPAT